MTWQTVARKAKTVLAWLHVALVLVLLAGALVLFADAQGIKKHIVYNYDPSEDRKAESIQQNSERITKLEVQMENVHTSEAMTNPIAMEGRIARLEQSLSTIQGLLITIVISMALLLVDAARRFFIKKEA